MLGTANEIHVWRIIDTNVLAINFEFGEFFAGNNFDISNHIFYSYQKFHYKKWFKLLCCPSRLWKTSEGNMKIGLCMSGDALISWAGWKSEPNRWTSSIAAHHFFSPLNPLSHSHKWVICSPFLSLSPDHSPKKEDVIRKTMAWDLEEYDERKMLCKFSFNRCRIPLKYGVFWEWPDLIRKKLGWHLIHCGPKILANNRQINDNCKHPRAIHKSNIKV